MAHSKSARKRIRQNAKGRLRNRSAKSALRTSIKKLKAAVDKGETDAAAKLLKVVQKTADKTVGKGIVHRKTSARIKSRLARKVNSLAQSD